MTSSSRLGRVAEPEAWSAVTMDAREGDAALDNAIIRESTLFPSSGNATNGKPIFNWDQAAAQLTRGGFTWSPTLGQSVTVTYAFRSTAPTTMPDGVDGFNRFTAAQIIAAEAALQLWADVANITFVRVGSGTNGDGAYSNNATILFSNYTTETDNAAGFAYLPSPSATGASQVQGDIWIDSTEAVNQNPVSGEYGMQVLAHEIGHAIGLRHPSDYDGGAPTYDADATWWQDSRMFTIMSYFGSLALGGSLGAFAAGPQLLDIAAAQRLYGANTNTRTGDTIYGFNSNTGRPHYTITSASQAAVFAIWDGGGNDTLDLSGYSQGGEIDLRPEAFSGGGPGNGSAGGQYNISIARGVIIENARGGSGSDTIFGNDAANALSGNGGPDAIYGGLGADNLLGGDGNDFLDGGGDNDILSGGLGDDVQVGGGGADAFDGGDGDDWLYVDGSDGSILGGAGFDRVFLVNASGQAIGLSGSGVELVWGNIGADYIDLTNNFAGGGTYYAVGDAGNDVIYGTSGTDVIISGTGVDAVFGNGGDDWLYVEAGDSLVVGGSGFDRAFVGGATGVSNWDLSSAAIEVFYASDGGNDIVHNVNSTTGIYLFGRGGGDVLTGGSGDDFLYGGAGADVLNGGFGNDVLWGGDGPSGAGDAGDRFEFRGAWGTDEIMDWQDGQDVLAFSVAGVTSANSLGYSYNPTTNISTFWYGDNVLIVHGLADRGDVLIF